MMRTSRWIRAGGCALVVGVALFVASAPAGALVVYSHGQFFGVSPRAGVVLRGAVHERTPKNVAASDLLDYHGGPVLHSNTTYAIFWDPSNRYPSSTRSNISKYFTDVAAASGTLSDVYAVSTQY